MTTATRPISRLVRVRAPHGVSDRMIVTIYPDGTLGLREYRRPLETELRVKLGTLYTRHVITQALRKNGPPA